MNTTLIKAALCVCAFSISLMASGPRVTGAMLTSSHNEIVAVETPPYYSSQYPTGGMAFEIVTAALNAEKETAILTTYPVQKMVNYYLTQEKVLAALGTNWNLSAAEKKNVRAIPLFLVREQYFYYKPFHPKGIAWGGKLSNLKGLTYGEHEGVDTQAYKKAGINVVYGRSRTLFDKLKTGKADFIGESAMSAQAIIDTFFASDKAQFATMEPNPEESVCTILFNLQNPEAEEMSQKFRKGLSSILKNGQYQAIIEKYEGRTPLSSQHIEKFKTLWAKELLK